MKIKLGTTIEEQEKEKAKKQREIEADIQQKNLERQQKIQKLHATQKLYKIIIISFVLILFGTLLTFGIYNIFVKKVPSDDYIIGLANTQINRYPTSGVESYLSTNLQPLFDKYMKYNSEQIQSVVVDTDSIYIAKIVTLDNSLAQVDFSVDVKVTEVDTEVTDPVLLEQLMDTGLFDVSTTDDATSETQTTEAPTTEAPTPVATTTDAESDEDDGDDPIGGIMTVTDDDGNVLAETSTEATTETTTEATTEATTTEGATGTDATQEDIAVIPNEIEYSQNSQNKTKTEYYVVKDKIYKKGNTYTTKYIFTVPIQQYKTETGAVGYKVVGDLSLQSLTRVDMDNFENITKHDYYKFNEETKCDEATITAARIKVDKTLSDLYNYRDTSQDFHNAYVFNTYNAKYISLTDFAMYNEPNQIGFNSYAVYDIEIDGVTYTIHAYLQVDADGNSWIITKYM